MSTLGLSDAHFAEKRPGPQNPRPEDTLHSQEADKDFLPEDLGEETGAFTGVLAGHLPLLTFFSHTDSPLLRPEKANGCCSACDRLQLWGECGHTWRPCPSRAGSRVGSDAVSCIFTRRC